MKLIKISKDHYVVVSDEDIKEGDWCLDINSNQLFKCLRNQEDGIYEWNDGASWVRLRKNCRKLTHSTEPLSEECKRCTGACEKCVDDIKPLSLSEVEEAINGYSVEKMAETYAWQCKNEYFTTHVKANECVKTSIRDYIGGFKAHQELVKDKLFTVEDMKAAWRLGYDFVTTGEGDLQSLLPKTEWDIEFINGKITLI